jgi:hypothetical protein
VRPPLSGPHGASLATTTGITAVITGVVATAVIAQAPPTPGWPATLAAASSAMLFLAASALYAARNAIGLALDHAADPALSGHWSHRAMRAYHLGMAALFAGLALLAAWRLGLAIGAIGWMATALSAGSACFAGWRASRVASPGVG